MTITNFDALERGRHRRNPGEDYAQRLLVEFTHPGAIVHRFAPTVLDQLSHYSDIVDTTRRLVLSALIVIAALRIMSWIPSDLAQERNTALFYDLQRQRDCSAEYVQNDCNETMGKKVCVELRGCLKRGGERVSVVKMLGNVVNAFFFPMSSKAAVFLGVLVGILLYRDLRRVHGNK
jgi:hypothetical protein